MDQPPTAKADDEAAPPVRPAATVVCLRRTHAGLETLLVQRRSTLVFHGGAWVFPGGRVDEADARGAGAEREGDAAARVAAVREAAEEASLKLHPERLAPLSHWTTPPRRPRRFATWFYLYFLENHQPVRVDGREITAHCWQTAQAALRAHREGALELPPPTFVTLNWLAGHASPEEAVLDAASRPLDRFVPHPCPVEGGVASLYHGDAGYDCRDPHQPGARHRLWMLERGWHYERTHVPKWEPGC